MSPYSISETECSRQSAVCVMCDAASFSAAQERLERRRSSWQNLGRSHQQQQQQSTVSTIVFVHCSLGC